MLYQILAFTIHGKIRKSHTKVMNLKYQLQRGITYLNYFTDHILYQIFKITLNIDYFQYILKKYGEKTDNPSINIYSKKMENRITLKIKTGYYLQHLTTETMKLLGGTKSQITKDENGENVPHLEITKVILIYCILSTTIMNMILESYIQLLLINRLVNY